MIATAGNVPFFTSAKYCVMVVMFWG